MEKMPAQIARERETIAREKEQLDARKNAELDRLRIEVQDVLTEYVVKDRAIGERLKTLQDECPHRNRVGSGKCPDCGR